jgi:hypothetical protein
VPRPSSAWEGSGLFSIIYKENKANPRISHTCKTTKKQAIYFHALAKAIIYPTNQIPFNLMLWFE